MSIRRRLALGAAVAAGLLGAAAVASIVAARTQTTAVSSTARTTRGQARTATAAATPNYPVFLGGALATGFSGFVPAIAWHGQTVVHVARRPSGVVLLAFDQRGVELHLHAGTADPGGSGWRYGPSVAASESRHLIAAFNGGFKLFTSVGGFKYAGRTGWPLSRGLGSIVTYSNGRTDIGSWRVEVPAPGMKVVSVRQNLPLLIDHGLPASSVGCITCWGATLGGVSAPARSALGITQNGTLIWAGGEHLTPAQLAGALRSAHVVRAVENDINPEWVAAYFYGHRGGHGPLAPVSLVPGQTGVPGSFLAPYSRDFFSIVAR